MYPSRALKRLLPKGTAFARPLLMKTPLFYAQRRFLALILLSTLVITSCREDDDPDKKANEEYVYVNSWIKENMDFWYYWNDQLPASPDKNVEPPDFFESLLHNEDRFSFMAADYIALLNSLQGISHEPGYEFVLYLEAPGSSNVLLQILYVKPASPAETVGLKRGDVITHINSQQITTHNYQELLADLAEPHTVMYRALNGEDFEEAKTLSVSPVQYAENPNYMSTVLDVNGKKVGYFIYNFFASGTQTQPGAYDAETDAIFAEFKSQGIEELILDLRFNSGGSESSARHLASLIGSGVDNSTVFLKREYNALVEQAILNDKDLGPSFLVSHFETKENNIGNQLTSGKVYILTGSRTASASELVINALKPFMEVFIIGETTVGKNMGSISIYEENDPKNTWGLQPIVVKVLNSAGQADYSNGFTPDILRPDNELILYPLGDSREPLLSAAIAEISGMNPARLGYSANREPFAHSLDYKKRSFRLMMNNVLTEELQPR